MDFYNVYMYVRMCVWKGVVAYVWATCKTQTSQGI